MRLPSAVRSRPEPALRGALLAGTALLYLVGLGRSGWGNSFYAAAAQAGSQSWSAFFFGSSDAGNSITVDKPPASLWVMALSARVFGLSGESLLVPQALMGVAAVAVLAATVRRVAGPWAGLLAGLLLAVTPVVTLMFRYDNPDALMTLLVVSAAWSTVRALEDPRLRWPVATGALLGLAFLAKSLQAFLVLPALAGVLLLAGAGPLRRRLAGLAAGGAALLVTAGWWPLAVALIPRSERPWVGGTTDDSPLGQALGYNGLGRILGERSPGGHTLAGGSPLRLLGSGGDQVGWLLPAAGVALVAGLLLTRGRPRTDPTRGSFVLWGGWALVTAAVLSTMKGIYHSYYSVELAPALAALVALGATALWRRGTTAALLLLAGATGLTTVWSMSLVERRLPLGSPLEIAVGCAGAAAVLGLVVAARNRSRGRAGATAGRVRLAAVVATVGALVLAPFAWSAATAGQPHHGSSVLAGPGRHRGTAAPRRPVSAAALALVRRDADDWRWSAAVVGHRAADLQLASGTPVMPIGGFAGTDPAPTLRAFESDVAHHRLHWYVAGPTGSGPGPRISAWVRSHAPAVQVGGTTLYDVGVLGPTGTDDDDRRFRHT